ncbi:MAG: hypothetical protein J7K20_02085 [Thermodesulfobacterium sp.]|nr:hypothetical protein [Thermodesulfobacterium sp.]
MDIYDYGKRLEEAFKGILRRDIEKYGEKVVWDIIETIEDAECRARARKHYYEVLNENR